jgi:hypothetical protein
MPLFCLQMLLWELITVAQNLKGTKPPTEVHGIEPDKGRFVGARTLHVESHMFGVEQIILF